jgi:hypothetical protein
MTPLERRIRARVPRVHVAERGASLLGALAVVLALAAGFALANATHPILILALVLGAVAAAASAMHPKFGLFLWLAVLVFVPHWLGLEAILYLPPVTLAGLVLVPAMLRGPRAQFDRVDGLLVVVLLGITAISFFGDTGRTLWAAMVVQWALAYTIGRRMSIAADVAWAAKAFAWLMVLVGAFAIVEFVTDWHPFVTVLGPSTAEAAWAPVISRGGYTRSEAAFGHPIALGAALVTAIPLLASSSGGRVARVVGVCVLLAGTFATLSRGPLLGAVVTVLLLVWAAKQLKLGARVAILGTGSVVAYYAMQRLEIITTSDATNLAASNATRSSVFTGLVEDMHPLGRADNIVIAPDGDLFYRGFTTIDNAFLLLGLHFGWLAPLSLALALLALTWRVVRGQSTPAGMALAGQWPVLLTVALVTQYAAVVWFLAGLAVSWAAIQREGAPSDTTTPGSTLRTA